jgi:hypothetical protein
VAIAVLSVGLAGFYFLLPINSSRALGPIPLTFCPHTGKINNHPVAEGLLITANLALAIFRLMMGGETYQLTPSTLELEIRRFNGFYSPFGIIVRYLSPLAQTWRQFTKADGLPSKRLSCHDYNDQAGNLWECPISRPLSPFNWINRPRSALRSITWLVNWLNGWFSSRHSAQANRLFVGMVEIARER